MNAEIKQILIDLVVDDVSYMVVGGANIPVSHFTYKGAEKTYITWQVIGEQPSLSANDECLYSTVTVDIDVISDGNYSNIVKEIKKRFKKNDWVWVEDSAEMYESETGLYQRVITYEKEKEIDNG